MDKCQLRRRLFIISRDPPALHSELRLRCRRQGAGAGGGSATGNEQQLPVNLLCRLTVSCHRPLSGADRGKGDTSRGMEDLT